MSKTRTTEPRKTDISSPVTLADYLLSPNGGKFLRLLSDETLRLGELPASEAGYDFVLLNEVESELTFVEQMAALNEENIASGKTPIPLHELKGNINLDRSILSAEPEEVMESVKNWVDESFGAFGIMECDKETESADESAVRRERLLMFKKWTIQ